MLLIKIESELDDCIDEALIVVPDKFDAKKVLSDIKFVIPEPTITEYAILYDNVNLLPLTSGFSEYREYIG